MRYNTPCTLYFACPFIFEVVKLTIDFAYQEDDGTIYYISEEGGYIAERDLFEFKDDAKQQALCYLRDFVIRTEHNIYNS